MQAAIGLVETMSIAKGIEACDGMLKMAEVDLVEAHPICAGKYIVLITGDVDAVRSSVGRGVEIAGGTLVDQLLIPNVHPQVILALSAGVPREALEALGVLETFTAASSILAADFAVKAAGVDLLEIRLARGMGGKSFVTLTGEVGAVQAAVRSGAEAISDDGALVQSVVIPRPHESMGRVIL
ncbi:MAG: BMC domain-containing protein [bacterium]